VNNKRKTPPRGPVALVRMQDDLQDTLAQTLDLCQGLEFLPKQGSVLLKPNLVGLPGKFTVPPFGVVTTTALVEALIRVLKDHGVTRLLLGDGGLVNKEAGTSTQATMETLGYPELARRYGLELVDLNQGPFEECQLDGLKLKLARPLLEADFVISLPVLKTHGQCKVSLALKNMKGGLHRLSKAACHDRGLNLDRNVALMAQALYPDLAIIDGRYALARGPLHFGTAQRADLLIAARDALDADLVGAAVIGQEPGQVAHLVEMARLLGRDLALARPVGGVAVEDVCLSLPWDFPWADEWTPAPFAKAGVKGVFMPKYDASLCTGCSFIFNPALVMLLTAGAGKDSGGVEFLTGKAAQPSGRARVSILAGKCIVKELEGDPRLGRVIKVPQCPPRLHDIQDALRQAGVAAELDAFRHFMAGLIKRYPPDRGFDPADYQPGAQA